MKRFIIELLIVLAIIITFIVIVRENKSLKADLVTISSNLSAERIKYKSESNKWAIQNRALEVEARDLRAVAKLSDDLLSDYEKKLKKAYLVIQDQNKKLKEVEAVNIIEIETTGTDSIPYKVIKIDTVFVVNISDFDDGYLKATFKPINEVSLKVDYIYHEKIDMTTTRQKDPKDQRFFLWRWIKPRYAHYSTITTGNDKSEILVNDYIYIKQP